MFIGHFGIGFGAKKLAPKLSLGFLFIAVQFSDLLWPVLLLLDIEHVKIVPEITKVTPLDFFDYPVSHSLALVIFWGLLCAVITRVLIKDMKYALIIFFCVISHWFLDLIMHRPDLPVFPGDPARLGLGLWNHPVLTLILEGIVFSSGVYFYYSVTSPKNNFGKYLLIILISLLVLVQIGNMFGPPPPNVNAIAWAGHLQWIFVILAFYADKNRTINQT